MNLLSIGCSYRNTPVEVRERLAFNGDRLPQALDTLTTQLDCEAVILSTCNRVELYLGQVLDKSASPANPSDFDYAGMLHDQGIRTVLSVPAHPGGLIVVERAGPLSFFGWLGKIESWSKAQLEKHLSAETSGVGATPPFFE